MKKVLLSMLLILIIGLNGFAQDDVMKEIWNLVRAEKYTEGLELVEKSIKEGEETSRLLQAKYYCLTGLEKYEDALQVALKREEIAERKSPWNCMDIVSMNLKLNKTDDALKWLEEAVDRGFISYQSFEEEEFKILKDNEKFNTLVVKIKDSIGIGKEAKDLNLELLDGSSFTLSEQKGKVILVDFWAVWCGPCRAEMPNLKKVYAAYKDKGFDIIGVSLDREKEKLDEYIEKEELGWNFSFSGEAWKDANVALYGVNSIPSMWLVDKNGVLRHFGLRGEALDKAIEELVAE